MYSQQPSMALELFFHFRRRLNGFYLAGLQGDRLQFLPTEAFAAQLEHRSIIKDAVQCAEQGGVLVEILAPQRWIFVAGENHVEVAFLVVGRFVFQERLCWSSCESKSLRRKKIF